MHYVNTDFLHYSKVWHFIFSDVRISSLITWVRILSQCKCTFLATKSYMVRTICICALPSTKIIKHNMLVMVGRPCFLFIFFETMQRLEKMDFINGKLKLLYLACDCIKSQVSGNDCSWPKMFYLGVNVLIGVYRINLTEPENLSSVMITVGWAWKGFPQLERFKFLDLKLAFCNCAYARFGKIDI
jgi:hypothetical protein